jgi:hypothetical protein
MLVKMLFVALATLILVFHDSVRAENCATLGEAIARVEAQGRGWRIDILKGDAKRKAIEVHRQISAKLDENFDTSILITRPDGAGAILLGTGGMLCAAIIMPKEHWFGVRQQILGRTA